jgi:hypothetical protein
MPCSQNAGQNLNIDIAEAWSLSLEEELGLRIFEINAAMRISGPKVMKMLLEKTV